MNSKTSSRKGSRGSTSSKNKASTSSSRQKYVDSDDEIDDEYDYEGKKGGQISGTKSQRVSSTRQTIPLEQQQPQIHLPDDWPVQKNDPFIQRGGGGGGVNVVSNASSSSSRTIHENEFPSLEINKAIQACSGCDITFTKSAAMVNNNRFLIILPGMLSLNNNGCASSSSRKQQQVDKRMKTNTEKTDVLDNDDPNDGGGTDNDDDDDDDNNNDSKNINGDSLTQPVDELKNSSHDGTSKNNASTTTTTNSTKSIIGRMDGMLTDEPKLTLPLFSEEEKKMDHEGGENEMITTTLQLQGQRVQSSTKFLLLTLQPSYNNKRKKSKVICRNVFNEVYIFGQGVQQQIVTTTATPTTQLHDANNMNDFCTGGGEEEKSSQEEVELDTKVSIDDYKEDNTNAIKVESTVIDIVDIDDNEVKSSGDIAPVIKSSDYTSTIVLKGSEIHKEQNESDDNESKTNVPQPNNVSTTEKNPKNVDIPDENNSANSSKVNQQRHPKQPSLDEIIISSSNDEDDQTSIDNNNGKKTLIRTSPVMDVVSNVDCKNDIVQCAITVEKTTPTRRMSSRIKKSVEKKSEIEIIDVDEMEESSVEGEEVKPTPQTRQKRSSSTTSSNRVKKLFEEENQVITNSIKNDENKKVLVRNNVRNASVKNQNTVVASSASVLKESTIKINKDPPNVATVKNKNNSKQVPPFNENCTLVNTPQKSALDQGTKEGEKISSATTRKRRRKSPFTSPQKNKNTMEVDVIDDEFDFLG